MSRVEIASPLGKRDLLYPKPGVIVDHAAYVEAYTAVERYEDALDFVDRADKPDPAWVKPILRYAVSHGDAHILQRIDRVFRDLVSVDDWKEAAGRAASAGKEYFAKQCRARAGIPEPAPAAQTEVSATPPPPPPEGQAHGDGHDHPHDHGHHHHHE